jgi:hypothetical protein
MKVPIGNATTSRMIVTRSRHISAVWNPFLILAYLPDRSAYVA